MKILVLDNYDSFTYNLVHLLRELGVDEKLSISRNDMISVDQVSKYDKVLLSPGPGLPKDAGIMTELIKKYYQDKSILGVCLGHQAIAENFGAELYNMQDVLHGISNKVMLKKQDAMFRDIPSVFNACRYHSWSIRPKALHKDLVVTAEDEQGEIMAISHAKYCLKGVQFHPESILTEHGHKMMDNWLKL